MASADANPSLWSESTRQALAALIDDCPRASMRYRYGTAGFRGRADTLPSVCVRMGVLAAARAACVGGQSIGCMITASHNPVCDNGLKLVDPAGDMMDASWEGVATDVCNAETGDDVLALLEAAVSTRGVDVQADRHLVVGYDTRESSEALCARFVEAAKLGGVQVRELGVVCTPVVHWVVRVHNDESDGTPDTLEGYYNTVFGAFKELVELGGAKVPLSSLIVDCANGVGALSVREMAKALEGVLPVELRNAGDGVLNEGVGADFTKTTRSAPSGFDPVADLGRRVASLDGDADRLVYFFFDAAVDGSFRLLDGDKITALATRFLRDLTLKAGLEDVRFGAVQTAYANGASTKYMRDELKVDVACTKTGVKHVHHKALEYDIGVYFEANGHGTVLLNDRVLSEARKVAAGDDAERAKAAQMLLLLSRLINQAIGDAVSDLLLVEAILALEGWHVRNWDALYTDLPSRLSKLSVPDRTMIHTTDAERQCTSPEGLQDDINALVAAAGGDARCFVRPSGTEDVVRIYAEASTQEAADALAADVGKAVRERTREEQARL